MLILYAIIILLTSLLMFLLFAKIKIFFEYKKYPGEKLYTDLRISIGFLKLDKHLNKLISNTSKKADKKSDNKDIKKKLSNYTKTFKILKKVYSKNRWYIRKRFNIDKLNLHLKFGLGDAAATGIMTGAIWSLLYSFLALLSQIGTVKKHFFEVAPVYTESGFAFQSSIKLSLRLINIISVVLRLYLTYKKVSKENK